MNSTKLMDSLKAKHRAVSGEFCGLNAALAIAQMEPHCLEDLMMYLRDLKKAHKEGDEASQEYLVEAIAEVFTSVEPFEPVEARTWEGRVAASPDGRLAAADLDDQQERFLRRYRELKERTGLVTQRDVAAASGLSLTTVNAVERGGADGGVRPHFKTVEKLAAGFNHHLPEGERVTAAELLE